MPNVEMACPYFPHVNFSLPSYSSLPNRFTRPRVYNFLIQLQYGWANTAIANVTCRPSTPRGSFQLHRPGESSPQSNRLQCDPASRVDAGRRRSAYLSDAVDGLAAGMGRLYVFLHSRGAMVSAVTMSG